MIIRIELNNDAKQPWLLCSNPLNPNTDLGGFCMGKEYNKELQTNSCTIKDNYPKGVLFITISIVMLFKMLIFLFCA